jgi:hypothetical protein
MPEKPKNGLGVDSSGGPVIDPTANVIALTDAANRRQDDLRALNDKLTDAKLAHLKEVSDLRSHHAEEMGKIREEHQEKIAKAEAARLDSIRQVDREEVAKTANAANMAISTLAEQTRALATTMAKTVTDTAAAQEIRNSAQYGDINKRVSALELSTSEGKGKSTQADPRMEELVRVVNRLQESQNEGSGRMAGASQSWALVAAVFMGLIAAGGLIAAVVGLMHK